MSTNIHFQAIRDIQVINTGKIETQTIRFNEWQTPTSVTNKIMESEDKIAAYKEWVLSVSKDVDSLIYSPDDIFCEGEPIGKTIINVGKDHVSEFESWLDYVVQEGYDVEVEAW